MVSTSPPNNLQKTEKFSLQTFRTFIFELKVLSKPFSKKLHTNLNVLEGSILLSQKTVSTSSLKNFEKKKIFLFKRPENSFLISRELQNHFLRGFPWLNFDLNSFWCFVSLSQKTVSTSSLKNLEKIEKCYFQMLRTFFSLM